MQEFAKRITAAPDRQVFRLIRLGLMRLADQRRRTWLVSRS